MTATKPTPCPSCGKQLDAYTAIKEGKKARPGDITLCWYCGHIMAFADDLTVRNLTDDEVVAVAGDRRILAAQKARALCSSASLHSRLSAARRRDSA